MKMCNKKYGLITAVIIAILTALAVSAEAQQISSDFDFKVEITGEGQDLILIPGLSSPGEVWDSTVEELSDEYRCHVISLPGFAGTEPIDFEGSFVPKMGDQIADYIKANNLNKPVIMGHSLGGFLSLYIGINYPELPGKLVSVDGVPFMAAMQNPAMTVEVAKPMAENMKAQMTNVKGEARIQMQKQIIATMVTDPEMQKIAVNWGLESDQKTVAQAMYDLYTIDLREQLDKIQVPVLVLGAWKAYENYGVTKDMAENMYNQQYSNLEEVTFLMSENGKHFLMWDDPAFLLTSFRSFMNQKL